MNKPKRPPNYGFWQFVNNNPDLARDFEERGRDDVFLLR